MRTKEEKHRDIKRWRREQRREQRRQAKVLRQRGVRRSCRTRGCEEEGRLMERSVNDALENLALDVDALAKRVENLKLRMGELRGLRLREQRRERDLDYADRSADNDLLKEVLPVKRVHDRVHGVWYETRQPMPPITAPTAAPDA